MNLFSRMFGGGERTGELDPNMTINDYANLYNQFMFGGNGYGLLNPNLLRQTQAGEVTEPPPNTFLGFAQQGYAGNGPIFALELVRMMVFSSVGFVWQNIIDGVPSETWGNDPKLELLRTPWKGGTTQDLLTSMILDADLAGNAYIGHDYTTNELFRMRPDWVDILLEPRYIMGLDGRGGNSSLPPMQAGWRKVGYLYTEGGRASENDPVFFLPGEVAHFAPVPDPVASYRGMSWLTPVIMELTADKAMTKHQRKYFENAATPNLIVKYEAGTTLDKVKAFRELMEDRHIGVDNAYKTMHLAPGADPVPVGANLKEIEFKINRGAGETRLASGAGVPPVIAGFSEGLAAATYANYSQARRRFADGTIHPLWENVAGCLGNLLTVPKGSRLWYDTKGVQFLREDEKDAAEIQKTEATTINSLISAGYKPESVIKAVRANDWRLLEHTGWYSVQLQRPGESNGNPNPVKEIEDNGPEKE